MVLIVLLRSLSLGGAFSALLTLMVLLHGTLLALFTLMMLRNSWVNDYADERAKKRFRLND